MGESGKRHSLKGSADHEEPHDGNEGALGFADDRRLSSHEGGGEGSIWPSLSPTSGVIGLSGGTATWGFSGSFGKQSDPVPPIMATLQFGGAICERLSSPQLLTQGVAAEESEDALELWSAMYCAGMNPTIGQQGLDFGSDVSFQESDWESGSFAELGRGASAPLLVSTAHLRGAQAPVAESPALDQDLLQSASTRTRTSFMGVVDVN